jgi:hypothetical protein
VITLVVLNLRTCFQYCKFSRKKAPINVTRENFVAKLLEVGLEVARGAYWLC